MYNVVITSQKGKKEVSKSYNFIGKLTPKVEEFWLNLKKYGKNIISVDVYEYSNEKGGKNE